MKTKLKGKTYLILEEGRRGDLRIVKSATRRPDLKSHQLAILVNVELSSTAFETMLPTATISVPDNSLIAPTVKLDIEDE